MQNEEWIGPALAARKYNTNRMRIWRAIKAGNIRTKPNGTGSLIYVPDLIIELNRPRKKPEYPSREWIDPEEIFWPHVVKTDYCWLWDGRSDGNYGVFGANGEAYRAHCFSYELHKGAIPEGLFVCHKCDVPPCVNPAHLFLGTPGDNTRDAMRKGRLARGIKIGISKLDPAAVREIRRKHIPRKYSARKLAEDFGVTDATIWAVLRGKTWRHIK